MALHASGIEYELREVELKNKPACMLRASAKGSVPVLVLPDGTVIDESWDIMQWALHQNDPDNWLGDEDAHLSTAAQLVHLNDDRFKQYLDRYKYADRYPEQSREAHREAGMFFLLELEKQLSETHYLLGGTMSIADAAIFPFIRQFADIDKNWFEQGPCPLLRNWLTAILNSPRFAAVMQKHTVWQPNQM